MPGWSSTRGGTGRPTLIALPGVEQVFCFENRGEEIGVTLAHPHGQIYGYPYLTPRTAAMMQQAAIHRTDGGNLFADLLAREIADGSRVVARTDLFTAFVPFAARWPVEVHIYPNRFVHNLLDLDRRRAGRVRADLPRCAAAVRPDVFRTAALYFGAAPVRRYRRAAGGLLPRRADVDPAQRHRAEVSWRRPSRRWTRSSAT